MITNTKKGEHTNMTISWDLPYKQKYLSFIYGKEWDKGEFPFFNFRKTPLGWDMNIHRLLISYDNWGKVKPNAH
jgi:hypothetical protein